MRREKNGSYGLITSRSIDRQTVNVLESSGYYQALQMINLENRSQAKNHLDTAPPVVVAKRKKMLPVDQRVLSFVLEEDHMTERGKLIRRLRRFLTRLRFGGID